MRAWAFAIWTVCALMIGVVSSAEAVVWTNDYQWALDQSRKTSKPIVLFFTGSDWCTWCQKLEHEVLDTDDFNQTVGDKLVFVKLDYPRGFKLDQRTEIQNQRLLQKYNIRAYPTVLVIDSNEAFLGNVSRNGNAQKFANDLLQAGSKNSAQR